MKNVAGATLRSGLEIILVSSVYEILAVRLSDTGNEKNNIFNITWSISYCVLYVCNANSDISTKTIASNCRKIHKYANSVLIYQTSP